MYKFMFPAILCLAVVCPTIAQAQDCGCFDETSTCQPTRKKLALIDVDRKVKRLRRVCETDECGCSQSRLALVSECVSRKRLALVDVPVDPCKRNVLQRMTDKVKGLTFRRQSAGGDCGCESYDSGLGTCDSGCGCDASIGNSIGEPMGESYPEIEYPTDAAPVQSAPVESYHPTDAGIPIEIAPTHAG